MKEKGQKLGYFANEGRLLETVKGKKEPEKCIRKAFAVKYLLIL